MTKLRLFSSASVLAICALATGSPASAKAFDIPPGDLKAALNTYAAQAGVLVVSSDAVNSVRSRGVQGDMSAPQALAEILRGTGFFADQTSPGQIEILKQHRAQIEKFDARQAAPVHLAAAASAGIESVVVTSSKIKGDIQTVPIAITALSQEQLTSRQIAGGPDLVKEVPNLTFSKTNFTGYNIQIRGIGTQAISVTTDPAVAVALNDIPFIRNHFFEQEFYDLSQAEVLRGPQGTLYGRNATAGVVNIVSAKPIDQFEAMSSADIGNYHNRRFEGMVNVPIVDDRLDLRVAGEWTKRDGYSTNQITDTPIDGRDLWSSRVTLGWKPAADMQVYLVWEHFQESDDRMRTAKQLCETAHAPTTVNGVPVAPGPGTNGVQFPNRYLDQGCVPTSLYSPDAFQVPDGLTLAYYAPLAQLGTPLQGGDYGSFDVYASTTQSRNLRVIESTINPIYKAKNDTLELNTDYNFSPTLTLTSQTGYNNDFLWSTEDYNRFNTASGAFQYASPNDNWELGANRLGQLTPDPNGQGHCRETGSGQCANATETSFTPCTPDPGAYVNTSPYACVPDGVFCDPQLGCADRLVAEDLSDERSWQLSQEFRLASNFNGPLNFSVGGNYLHYETDENYYVFINTITLASASPIAGRAISAWDPGVSDNHDCQLAGYSNSDPHAPSNPQQGSCPYIDPNPLTSLNNEGHNYFLSQNPYVLNSYAGFGEVYYNVTNDVKLTGGLRWTEDRKHFIDIPSELFVNGYGYAETGVVNQQWDQLTGRAVANWAPKLDFTDQTLLYGSFAHGYKGGGANPPGAVLLNNHRTGEISDPIHPLTFRPEFIDAYELGTKNTLLDGALTLNGDVFYYNYKDYQISEIVDRTSINLNFNATVKGAELETTWEATPGLKFTFAGGYEDATLNKGDSAVDLMDRADSANHPDWMVVKPFITQASNCILPAYVVAEMLLLDPSRVSTSCGTAYGSAENFDPATGYSYVANPAVWCPAGAGDCSSVGGTPIPNSYAGFDPSSAPNNGAGFSKNLSGNQLPNAPHFTTSLSADYTLPVSENWAATLHGDFYWQSQSFARVFNDRPYDKIRGYSNVNLALILTSAGGWQVMGYLKNVFNVTAITGDFLNSDDSGLTTNVFLTDPRLFGVRVTKNF